MTQRKQYTAQFKAKVAMEAITGHRTVNEIASAYGVHPTQVTNWKHQAIKRLPEIRTNGSPVLADRDEALIDRLCQQIGQLTMENEYLKKNPVYAVRSEAHND